MILIIIKQFQKSNELYSGNVEALKSRVVELL